MLYWDGQPSSEIPTTETTTVQYVLLVTFETDDNYSIRFKMNKTLLAQH